MSRKYVVGVVVLGVILSLVVSACGGSSNSSTTASSGGDSTTSGETSVASSKSAQYKIALILKDNTNPYWKSVTEGVELGADNTGQELIEATPNKEEPVEQINVVEAQMAAGTEALVVAPDGEELKPILEEATEKGIKVILVDSPIPSWTGQTSFDGTDNEAAGEAGAKAILEALPESNPQIGLIGQPGVTSVEARMDGAKKVLDKAGVTPVQEVNGKCEQQLSENVTEDLLQAHPDLTGIFAACSGSDLGAVQALRTTGTSDVKIMGVDGTEEELEAIEAGTLYGTVAQRPAEMGTIGFENAVKALEGNSIPKSVAVPFDVVTKANVQEFAE
jgi:ribose transport system substrate-binding protein